MTPDALRALMQAHRLTAATVAVLVHATERAVYYWLAGKRAMPAAASELLVLKAAAAQDQSPACTTS